MTHLLAALTKDAVIVWEAHSDEVVAKAISTRAMGKLMKEGMESPPLSNVVGVPPSCGTYYTTIEVLCEEGGR